jgi:isoleucyl-tRNA synthetase
MADPSLIVPELTEQMGLVQRAVEVGRATRAAAKARIRQPLARALVADPDFAGLSEEWRAEIAEELNVTTVAAMSGDLVETSVKPNWRALGVRFGRSTPQVAAVIAAAALPQKWPLRVSVGGVEHEITQDEVTIVQTPRAGWAVSSEGGLSVALDLEITDDLRRAGLARDVQRMIQDQRKAAGLEVTDRIKVRWRAEDRDTAAAVREHTSQIAAEVLAVSLTEAALDDQEAAGWHERTSAELGLVVRLARCARP